MANGLSDYVQEVKDRMQKGESYESATKAAAQGRSSTTGSDGISTYGSRSGGTKKIDTKGSVTNIPGATPGASKGSSSKSSSSSQKPPTAPPSPNNPDEIKSARAYIDQTVKGGLSSYIATQQARYANAGKDTDLKSRLEADARRLNYSLSYKPVNVSGSNTGGKIKTLTGTEEDMTEAEKSIFYGNQDSIKNDKGQYAYTDTYGFEHVADLASALAYSRDGNVQAYTGAASGGYARDAEGNRAMMGLEGSRNYGNAPVDPKTGEKLSYKADGAVGEGKQTLKDFLKPTTTASIPSEAPPAAAPSTGIDPNQKAYLEGLVAAGGPNGTWAKEFLKTGKEPVAPGAKQPATPAASTPANGMDPNQKTYLESLVAAGGANAAWAKEFLKTGKEPAGPAAKAPATTPATTPATNPNDQKTYLQGLIAKGGGNGEWAKAELAKLEKAQAPAATPASSDMKANAMAALQAGDYATAAEWINKRAAKIAGLTPEQATPEQIAAFQADQKDLMARLEQVKANQVPTSVEDANISGYEKEMQAIIDESQGDQKKALDAIVKYIEKSGTVTPDEIMSFEQAKAQAGASVDPKYDEARQQRQEQLTTDALRRGFYGQKSSDVQMFQEMGNLENQRAAEVATLAQGLVGQSKEDSYRKATYEQAQVQQKLSNMMSILQAKGQLSQTMIANLQALMNNEHTKKSEAMQEKQLNASLYGMVDGKPTIEFQNMMKSWGYSDAEAARAAELFPYQLEQAKLSVSAARKSLAQIGAGRGVAAEKAAYDAAVAVQKQLQAGRTAADAAGKAAEARLKSTIPTGATPTMQQLEDAYNKAYDAELELQVPKDAFEQLRKIHPTPGASIKELEDFLKGYKPM